MTQQPYVYRVTGIERVVDGDTYWLRLDVGFRQTMLTEIRLLGADCPETHHGSAFERAHGVKATLFAEQWLVDALDGDGFEDGLLWVRTQKDPDDFGRWLGEVWREPQPIDLAADHWLLVDDLVDRGLATRWPTRWHETYDPQRDKTSP